MLKSLALTALIPLLFSSCFQEKLTTIQGQTMGTTYTIKLYLGESKQFSSADEVKKEVEAIFEKVNALMSTYRKDSEISLFNRWKKTDAWFRISPDFAYVATTAQQISIMSDGMYDATVGPLVNLWGFGPKKTSNRVPSEDQQKKAQERVGFEKLSARMRPPGLKKKHPKLYLDLSGIAKGYGVDKAVFVLAQKGFRNFYVEVGGEIRVGGKKDGNDPWTIAIEAPIPGQKGKTYRTIDLKNMGIATSGGQYNFFEVDDKKYTHTIDPKQGKPVQNDILSVSVIDSECMRADAYATAINTMGSKEGLTWAKKHSLRAYIIHRREDGTLGELMTPLFKKLLVRK